MLHLVIVRTVSFKEASLLSMILNGQSIKESGAVPPEKMATLDSEWLWCIDEDRSLTGWRGENAQDEAKKERPGAVVLDYHTFSLCWSQPFAFIKGQCSFIKYLKGLLDRCNILTGYDSRKMERGGRRSLSIEIGKAIKNS